MVGENCTATNRASFASTTEFWSSTVQTLTTLGELLELLMIGNCYFSRIT